MKRLKLLTLSLLMSLSVFAHERPKFEFKENKGQWPDQVHFRTDFANVNLFLEPGCLTWQLIHPEDLQQVHDMSEWTREEQLAFMLRRHAYKVHFVDANESPNIFGQDKNDAYYNYFLGDDESKWASRVESYSVVRYADIWDDIGMRFYNKENNLKYDIIVNAGGDVSDVKLLFDGIEEIELVNGEIRIQTSVGEVIEQAPFAYQLNGSQLEEVACNFVLNGEELSFVFPEGYDESRKLVIDPIVIASTLSGTTGSSNYGHSAAYDVAGNIYTGARSFGAGYPTTTGAVQETFSGGGWGVDMAMSKLNPTGTELIWASYLGGDGADYPHSLICNDFEELYVYGSTDSGDFPTTAGAYQQTLGGAIDIAVAHFSADGTVLMGSTYVGGSQNDGFNAAGVNYGDGYRGEIILSYEERPLVASFSSSSNFPVSSGAYQSSNAGEQDVVVFAMNTNLSSLTWSTYIGGSTNDTGYGLRQTIDGSVYVAGMAGSQSFPTTAGAYQTTFEGGGGWSGEMDGFIAKLSGNGSNLEYSTFFGTAEEDQVFFIDLDNDENVWVYGQSSGDMPVNGDVFTEANGTLFIAKFEQDLSDIMVSSVVAPGSEWGGYAGVPVAFLVDRCDNIYISAYSAASGLTTTDDAVYTTGGFYLAAYGEDISTVEFASYYGSNHVDGGTSRFDKNGIIYQGVCSGGDFPTNGDAFAPDQFTGWDIGVFKMDFEVSGVNAVLTASAEALNGCAPHNVDFNNYSVGNIFTWNFGDGSPESNEFEPSHLYEEPGLYEVSLISMDSLSCNVADTAYVEISVSIPTDFEAAFEYELDCENLSVTTNNTTGVDWLDYEWDMGDGTILEGFNVEHIYGEEGDFTITLSAIDNGCEADDDAEEVVSIVGSVIASTEQTGLEGCSELTVDFTNTSNGLTYEWDFGDGSPVVEDENPSHTFSPGTYTVTLTAYHPESCNLEDQTELEVVVGPDQVIDAAFDVIQTDCESFLVEGNNASVGEYLGFSWDMGDGTVYDTENILHNYAAIGIYEVELTITDTLCDATDTETLNITVLDEVTAIIGNGDIEGCDPFLAEFQNNSLGSTFTWDFGDGSAPQIGQDVSHEYLTPGEYTVTLTVEGTGNCGGTDITTATVNVIETPQIIALFDMNQQGECEEVTAVFNNQSIGDNLSYNWTIEGLNYDEFEVEHTFIGPGTYDVTLSISEDLCDATDSFTAPVEVVAAVPIDAPEEEFICYYDLFTTVSVNGPEGTTYEWSTGEEESEIIATEPGTYQVTATYNNCTSTHEIEVKQGEELALYSNPKVCEGTEAILEIPYADGSNYLWCDGTSLEYIYAGEPGEYCYTFTDINGCLQDGVVEITQIPEEARVYIPNAFTPNGDGVNDFFKAEGVGLQEYELTIWNRWGEQVFATESIDAVWDGSHTDGEYYIQNEVYTYMLEYNSTCKPEKIVKNGQVLILR